MIGMEPSAHISIEALWQKVPLGAVEPVRSVGAGEHSLGIITATGDLHIWEGYDLEDEYEVRRQFTWITPCFPIHIHSRRPS